MTFDIKDKVALITGAASGIGLEYAKELLKNGLRGVTLADINDELGKKAVEELTKQFGKNRAIYVKTDVSDQKQFENAFHQTIAAFKNIDILINNAGIMNDKFWEKEIAINLNGTIYGVLLALDFIPKHRTGNEGVIANISSIAGLEIYPNLPIYVGTKFAVQGLSRCFGDEVHYKRTGVKIVTMCPGVTDTPLISDCLGRSLGPEYDRISEEVLGTLETQPPENVAKGMVTIIKEGNSGSVWVSEENNPPYELVFQTRTEVKKKD